MKKIMKIELKNGYHQLKSKTIIEKFCKYVRVFLVKKYIKVYVNYKNETSVQSI